MDTEKLNVINKNPNQHSFEKTEYQNRTCKTSNGPLQRSGRDSQLSLKN